MTNSVMIRKTTSSDIAQILDLYPQAFPEEELRPVVSALLEGGHAEMSLAGYSADILVAHVLFTVCGTEKTDPGGSLLAPLGVIPSFQRRGVGSALVDAGLRQLTNKGIRQVLVLGDPQYYGRFGFSPERRVLPPYPLAKDWADAWQSLSLKERVPLDAGQLLLPKPWMDPKLWQP